MDSVVEVSFDDDPELLEGLRGLAEHDGTTIEEQIHWAMQLYIVEKGLVPGCGTEDRVGPAWK